MFCTGSQATVGAAATTTDFGSWRDNFRTTFRISFICDRIDDLTYRSPDWILVDFRRDFYREFSRSIMEFAISQPKWSDCHETKRNHIDWILGLRYDYRIWPWPWPLPWIFKVKYRFCYISAKNGPVAKFAVNGWGTFMDIFSSRVFAMWLNLVKSISFILSYPPWLMAQMYWENCI